jgi:5-methylthioadenosine/S-adenosylhomocysteine deaminase
MRDQCFAPGTYGRLRMGMALRGPCLTSAERNADDYAFARDLGLPISVHVGLAATADAVTTLQRYSLLGAGVNYVHGNMLTDREFDLIAETQGTVTITPSTGMLTQFGTFPATGPKQPFAGESSPASASTCDPRTSTDSATRSPS